MRPLSWSKTVTKRCSIFVASTIAIRIRANAQHSLSGLPTTKPRDSALRAVTKEVVGTHVLLKRPLFGGDILRRLLPRVSLASYIVHFPAKVKNGVLHGEWRNRAAPYDWFEINGKTEINGTAILHLNGAPRRFLIDRLLPLTILLLPLAPSPPHLSDVRNMPRYGLALDLH